MSETSRVSPMRSVDEHLAEILRTVRVLAPLELELDHALGTTLAEEVLSPIPLPPFDNSAMDGYAVRAEDVKQAPVTLPVIDDVAAGDGRMLVIGPGMVTRIMTGAPLPVGADAVVPVEWTDGGTARVTISRPVQEGHAIRRAGEDVHAGDVVITSGGVSMGAYEPVKEALGPLGTVRFDRVAMQPGMPQGFGVVGEDQVPLFALPGNPVSSFVSFMVFVRPALRKMRGLPAEPTRTVRAVTTSALRSPQGKRSHLRGVLTADGAVAPVQRQGSHQFAALAAANALIVVPEGVTELPEGTTVEVIPL
jgi:molybdopterin biosynthesis enzyme